VATIRSPIAATLSIADSPHGCGVDIQVEPSVDSHISLLKLCRSNRSNRELVGKKDWPERLPKAKLPLSQTLVQCLPSSDFQTTGSAPYALAEPYELPTA
jgi:hypothetical protein